MAYPGIGGSRAREWTEEMAGSLDFCLQSRLFAYAAYDDVGVIERDDGE